MRSVVRSMEVRRGGRHRVWEEEGLSGGFKVKMLCHDLGVSWHFSPNARSHEQLALICLAFLTSACFCTRQRCFRQSKLCIHSPFKEQFLPTGPRLRDHFPPGGYLRPMGVRTFCSLSPAGGRQLLLLALFSTTRFEFWGLSSVGNGRVRASPDSTSQ
eukprot:3904111-Rhodomonas_salina.1